MISGNRKTNHDRERFEPDFPPEVQRSWHSEAARRRALREKTWRQEPASPALVVD